MSSYYAHFLPSNARSGGSHFLGTWNPTSCSTFSLDSPTTSTLGTPASSRRTTLASGSASRSTATLTDGEVIEPVILVGVPQRTATLPGRDSRPPLRVPVWAVVGGGRGAGLPFLHLNRISRGNAVVVLGESVRSSRSR